MKKITTLLVAASLGLSTFSFAQQDPQFTQFMYIKQAYNPAVVGTTGSMCFDALYRQQWVNFPGAPKTGVFCFNMPLPNIPIGVGLTVLNDQIGFQNTTEARLAAAYHITIGTGILSLGFDGGIYQTTINGNYIAPQTLNDPRIPNNPNSGGGTGSPNLNKLNPDFGGGIYYTIPNKVYIGISSTHVSDETLNGANGAGSGIIPPSTTPVATAYKLAYDVARHYYVIAGYTFNLRGGEDALMPNIIIKTDAASTQLDVNLTYMYKKMIGLGLSYRVQDAVAPMIVYKAPFGLRVAYSYDVTTSKIKGYSSGTHEISLGYCFKPKAAAKPSSHWNTRYFAE
ncbi:MAG: PorP/SprF family type IX secretion system membrane protein [Bacteroidia bacterium]